MTFVFSRTAVLAVLSLSLLRPAKAALQPRLGGAAVYDTDQNITWLTNANLAASNQFGTAGINARGDMPWDTAQNWIASMNAANYLGFSNWRLPNTREPDPTCSKQDTANHVSSGFSCKGGEMGHLYYVELGGQASMSISAQHNSSYALFTNLQDLIDYGIYWSGSTDSADSSQAWEFSFEGGDMELQIKPLTSFVMAVLPGDVAPSQILSQFVFGGGWYSAIYFNNSGTSPVSLTVSFFLDSGAPLTVPSVGGSSTAIAIAARGTAIVEAPNIGSVNQGYALVALPPGVTGYGVFRQSVPGFPDQEAVVPLTNISATTSTLIWDDTGFTTAVAVANPSSVPVTVSVTAWDNNGNLIGTSSIRLLANNKTETALRALAGLAGIAGKRGSAQFTVSSGNLAVLGLRFGTSAFTSIPTTQQ